MNAPTASVAHAGTSGRGGGGAGTRSSRDSIPPCGRRQVNPGSARSKSTCDRSPSAVHSAAIASGGFSASTERTSGGYAGHTTEISSGGPASA